MRGILANFVDHRAARILDRDILLARLLADREIDAAGIAQREFQRPGLDLRRHDGGLKRIEREDRALHVS